jgi:hypothetical protein
MSNDDASRSRHRFAVHWVYGNIAADVRQAIVAFWLREGAIGSADEAWRRSWEAACVLRDVHTAAIAGVCTVALRLDDADRSYGYLRIYVGKASRQPGLGVRLVRGAIDGFESMIDEPGAPGRIVANLENPKLAQRGGARLLSGVGFTAIGQTPDGQLLVERLLSATARV